MAWIHDEVCLIGGWTMARRSAFVPPRLFVAAFAPLTRAASV